MWWYFQLNHYAYLELHFNYDSNKMTCDKIGKLFELLFRLTSVKYHVSCRSRVSDLGRDKMSEYTYLTLICYINSHNLWKCVALCHTLANKLCKEEECCGNEYSSFFTWESMTEIIKLQCWFMWLFILMLCFITHTRRAKVMC